MAEKVDLDNLKRSCERMASLLADRQPGLMSWHFAFREVADEIRYELDGSESPSAAVRLRVERESASQTS